MTRTLRQIDQVRKGACVIEARDEGDRPCPAAGVWVEQETHAFLFGCVAPDLSFLSESQRQRCRRRITEVFNYTPSPDDLSSDRNTTTLDLSKRQGARCPIRLPNLRDLLDETGSSGQLVEVVLDGAVIGLDLSEREQAERLANLYTFCFAHAAVRAIIWRGLCDGELPPGRGGLLRADLGTKHAFKTLRKLVREIWHTRAAGHSDKQGRFEFRGFFGDYRVGIATGKVQTKIIPLSLRKNPTGPIRAPL